MWVFTVLLNSTYFLVDLLKLNDLEKKITVIEHGHWDRK